MADGFRLTSLGRDVLSRYREAGLSARMFLNLRWRWTPYEEIARRIPAKGVILDLGLGHGLLALSEPARIVRGFDHDEKRAEQLNFRSRADWLLLLAKAGLAAACEPCSRFPFADRLFTSTSSATEIKKAA